MSNIEFDAIAGITIRTLGMRAKKFQRFFLRPDTYRNQWRVFRNRDEARASAIGNVEAVQYRPQKIIIAVTTSSLEFAHIFKEWLQQYCGAVILADLSPLPIKPIETAGRKRLDCNEWAYEQRYILKRPYDDFFEGWKQKYEKETGEDPNAYLTNPRKSMRQAILELRKKKRQEID